MKPYNCQNVTKYIIRILARVIHESKQNLRVYEKYRALKPANVVQCFKDRSYQRVTA